MLATRLTSRRGAWTTLVVGLLLAFGLIGALRGSQSPAGTVAAPTTSESARADAALATLPDSDVAPVLLVATRADGGALTEGDLAGLTRLGASLPHADGARPSPAIPAQDGRAAMVQVPVTLAGSSSGDAETVTALRDAVRDARPDGLDVLVTGGPAFGADIAKSFEGANVTLLLTPVGIVALLLLLTYRSPVLWLVPLAVVGIADQLAAVVTARLGQTFDLQFDAGIVSVLVFGAGTNYALLLISRYREELHAREDHRAALASAWRATVPAILASNLTVVLALGSLVFAVIPGTHGLGVASAVGLLLALVAVLTLLPAALAVCGRRVFWPFVPTVQQRPTDPERGVFGRVAGRVMRRPGAVVAGSLALLAVLACGLVGTKVGLEQTERFRTPTESSRGLEVLAQHYPAGEAQPLTVVTDTARVEAVTAAAQRVDGVTSARPGRAAGTAPGDLATVTVVTDADPGTPQARDQVAAVREAVHAAADDALVGGQQAVDLDARDGNTRDTLLIVPLVLLVTGVVLLVLLRSLLAPLVLLAVNALSSLATIGAGSFIGRHLLGWPALDLQVPLLAYLFLVALGIDYTIFLVHRAQAETAEHGTRRGMVRAVGATGAVITSAGIVLAAVFAALGVLPLVTLGQIGLIVGLGVVLDTSLVRTVLVPGLFGLLGDRMWWPRRVQ